MNTTEVQAEEYYDLLEKAKRCEYLEGLLDFLDDMIPCLDEVIEQYCGE